MKGNKEEDRICIGDLHLEIPRLSGSRRPRQADRRPWNTAAVIKRTCPGFGHLGKSRAPGEEPRLRTELKCRFESRLADVVLPQDLRDRDACLPQPVGDESQWLRRDVGPSHQSTA